MPDIDYSIADLEAVAAHIGKQLRAQRKARRLSAQALADRAGIGRRTLHTLETTGRVDFLTILRVLRALTILDRLSVLEQEPLPSPLEALRRQRKQR